jgi:hypothetical protein
VMPLARLLHRRVAALNDAIRSASAASGALVCDLARQPVASDPRLWSDDRLHANAAGHGRIAEALAMALQLPGASDAWREPLPDRQPPRLGDTARAELAWLHRHLLPWLWRHARGRSSGDGVQPKVPQLTLVAP